MAVETAVEFTHRLSSGAAFLLVLAMLLAAWRVYPKGHRVRQTALLAMVFMIFEALVGAGLVLFKFVADDTSIGRVFSISIHLINTFLLLASLALTAWFASGGNAIRLTDQGLTAWAFGIGFFGLLIIGISGAITALGDTLFPSGSLVEGFQQDISPTAHFLIRLRVWHPVIAIVTGFYVVFLVLIVAGFKPERPVRVFAWILGALFLTQLLAGLINLALLAPLAMQMIHLFLADMVWISMVLFAATSLRQPVAPNI
jgi:heme A synthase